MIDIDNKITSFHKMVYSQAKAKSNEMLLNSAETDSNLIEEKVLSLEKAKEDYIQRRIKFANQKSTEMTSKAGEDANRELIEKKKNLLDQLLSAIRDELRSYTKTEEYKKYLISAISKEIKFNPKNTIKVREEDLNFLKKEFSNTKFESTNDDIIGGYISVFGTGRLSYDHSFETAVDDKSYEIGKKLNNTWSVK